MSQVKLLTELHWSLPHPLTASESLLKSQELPSMAKQVEQLRVNCKVFNPSQTESLPHFECSDGVSI